MLSRENRVILFAVLVLTPLSLVALAAIDGPLDVPTWVGGVVVVVVAVLLPQLYLGYREESTDETNVSE